MNQSINAERLESLKLATRVAVCNGYSPRSKRKRRQISTNVNGECGTEIPLCLPYISDKVSRAFRQCVMQAQLEQHVVLVDIPADNIDDSLSVTDYRSYISKDCIVCSYGKESLEPIYGV